MGIVEVVPSSCAFVLFMPGKIAHKELLKMLLIALVLCTIVTMKCSLCYDDSSYAKTASHGDMTAINSHFCPYETYTHQVSGYNGLVWTGGLSLLPFSSSYQYSRVKLNGMNDKGEQITKMVSW